MNLKCNTGVSKYYNGKLLIYIVDARMGDGGYPRQGGQLSVDGKIHAQL